MSRSGRVVTLWVLIAYAMTVIGAALSLRYWHPTTASTGPVKLARLRRLVESNPDRPLLVMLGSSRTDSLFVARRLSGLRGPYGKPWVAFNFGMPGTGAIHERVFLREMLDAGIRPRLLLVEFQTTLLNEPGSNFASEERCTTAGWRTLPELLGMLPYFAHPARQCLEWLQARLLPAYMFRCWLAEELVLGWSAKPAPKWDESTDPWGYRLPDWPGPAECARRLAYTRKEFCEGLRHFRVAMGPSQAMRDLLELCRRERVPVVLVVPPESTLFRSWYAPQGLAEIDRLLVQLHATYRVPILDARGWVEDKDFHDGHHVKASGAQVFTTRLLDELRPILGLSDEPGRPQPTSAQSPPAAETVTRRRLAEPLAHGTTCSPGCA
jgi:hypothetical protein